MLGEQRTQFISRSSACWELGFVQDCFSEVATLRLYYKVYFSHFLKFMHDLSSRSGCQALERGFWGCWVQLRVRLSILPRLCPRLLHNPNSVLAQICKPLTTRVRTTTWDSPCSFPRSPRGEEACSCLLHGSKPGSPGDPLTLRSPA